MSNKEIEKKVPDIFKKYNMPPEGAREDEILVFRACRTNKVDADSFLPTYIEENYQFDDDEKNKNPGIFGMSTYTKAKDVKRFAITNSEYRKPLKIAIGKTNPRHGLIQPTKERDKKSKSSHVDWWLYEKACPHEEFDLIEDFEEYYKNIRGGNT